MMCTHTGRRNTVVKAEENLFEYKQRALLETIVTHTFSLRDKLLSWEDAYTYIRIHISH